MMSTFFCLMENYKWNEKYCGLETLVVIINNK